MEQKIIVFLDSIQRTIVATLVSSDTEYLVVTKPAILNVAPTQDKKLQVQLYPLMFREFIANRDVYPEWSYSKTNITTSTNLDLEPNLLAQYVEMFKPSKPNEPAPTIKLFDADEEKK
jgi:hypothetical protein